MLYLGFIITDTEIEMTENHISVIVNWSESESVHKVQMFLDFVNFYQRFIESFFCIAASLTETFKEFNMKLKKELTLQRLDFLPSEIKIIFKVLIETFISTSFLQHFNVELLIHVETDASDFAIFSILTQKHMNDWRSTVYFSQKMISVEWDYETHDEKLLTIVKSFCHWRHYLEGLTHLIEILTNHTGLWSFMTTHKLSWRQVQWALSLSVYDFVVVYWKGILNSADSSSWRPDHQHEVKQKNREENASVLQQILFSTVALISVKSKNDLLTWDLMLHETLIAETTSSNQQSQRKQICEAVLEERLYKDIEVSLVEILLEFLKINLLMKHMFEEITAHEINLKLSDLHSLWLQREKILYFDQMLYILYTETLQIEIILKHHDNSLAEHLITEKTFTLIRAKYYWSNMWKQIQKYCNSHLVCQRVQIIHRKQSELLQSILILNELWEVLTLDFITELSESQAYEGVYNAILVMVCKFSKITHYISAHKNWTAEQLTEVYIREIIKLHRVVQTLISDHRSVFTSQLWVNLMFTLKIDCWLSTAFHPQTDEQTEQQNSTLEQYLQSYVNYQQDNWASLLLLTEFTYNISLHSSIRKALFEVIYECISQSDMLTAEKVIKYSAVNRIATEAKQLTEHLCNTQLEIHKALTKAQKYQAKHYNKFHLNAIYKVSQLI